MYACTSVYVCWNSKAHSKREEIEGSWQRGLSISDWSIRRGGFLPSDWSFRRPRVASPTVRRQIEYIVKNTKSAIFRPKIEQQLSFWYVRVEHGLPFPTIPHLNAQVQWNSFRKIFRFQYGYIVNTENRPYFGQMTGEFLFSYMYVQNSGRSFQRDPSLMRRCAGSDFGRFFVFSSVIQRIQKIGHISAKSRSKFYFFIRACRTRGALSNQTHYYAVSTLESKLGKFSVFSLV